LQGEWWAAEQGCWSRSAAPDSAAKGAAVLSRGGLRSYLPGAQACSVLGESCLSRGQRTTPPVPTPFRTQQNKGSSEKRDNKQRMCFHFISQSQSGALSPAFPSLQPSCQPPRLLAGWGCCAPPCPGTPARPRCAGLTMCPSSESRRATGAGTPYLLCQVQQANLQLIALVHRRRYLKLTTFLQRRQLWAQGST